MASRCASSRACTQRAAGPNVLRNHCQCPGRSCDLEPAIPLRPESVTQRCDSGLFRVTHLRKVLAIGCRSGADMFYVAMKLRSGGSIPISRSPPLMLISDSIVSAPRTELSPAILGARLTRRCRRRPRIRGAECSAGIVARGFPRKSDPGEEETLCDPPDPIS
eukprot:12085679-Alexandrium_andersonii.AAC.2